MNEEEKSYKEAWNDIIKEEFRDNSLFKDVIRELAKNFEGAQWRCLEDVLIEKEVFKERDSKWKLIKTEKGVRNKSRFARALKHTGLTQTVRAIEQSFGQKYQDAVSNAAGMKDILPTRADKKYVSFDNSKLTDTPDSYSFVSTDTNIASVQEGCITVGDDGTCIILLYKDENGEGKKVVNERYYYKVKVEGRQLYDASKNPPSLVSTDKPVGGGQNPGSENGHECVDLGLSVKWATCNVGAVSPGEYGDYFAWGETSPKDEYTWGTLKYCNDETGDSFSKYNQDQGGTKDNRTRLELSDDAARQQWGGSWRMPTREEFQELVVKCRWSWTTEGGHEGYKVTGPNGNSIFLPAAGCRLGSSLDGAGEFGDYWSSSLSASYSYNAYDLYFSSGNLGVSSYGRCFGRSVRSVTE